VLLFFHPDSLRVLWSLDVIFGPSWRHILQWDLGLFEDYHFARMMVQTLKDISPCAPLFQTEPALPKAVSEFCITHL